MLGRSRTPRAYPQAKAEAFKAREQAKKVPKSKAPKASPGGSGATLAGDKAPARLVGGDAGSLRQAAPFQPGDSKAGAISEGWSQSQIDDMLEAEAEWKQQLALKKEEERAANALAADAARFTIGAHLGVCASVGYRVCAMPRTRLAA